MKRDWSLTTKQENIYHNLERQVEKLLDYKTHHQGRRGTERYRNSVKIFAKHLTLHFGSQNFRNIHDQHLKTFIEESRKAGVAVRTIKNDLSAIRKFHGKIQDARYRLSSNEKLGVVERRRIYGVERAWLQSEFQKAVNLAAAMGRDDLKWGMQLAFRFGLRIEETTVLTRTHLRDALKKGYLSLKTTKNNIHRDVPLDAKDHGVLQEILMKADPNRERIFIRHGQQHHQVFKSLQNWIANHRNKFEAGYSEDPSYLKELNIEEDRETITFHGLRHAYALEQYLQYRAAGLSVKNARLAVAEHLGHGRDKVTRVYLGRAR